MIRDSSQNAERQRPRRFATACLGAILGLMTGGLGMVLALGVNDLAPAAAFFGAMTGGITAAITARNGLWPAAGMGAFAAFVVGPAAALTIVYLLFSMMRAG